MKGGVRPLPTSRLDHRARVFLLDQKGRLREIYHLGFLKAKWVVEDIELLLNEKK